MTTPSTTEQRAAAATRRLRDYINRAAGQHSRAVAAQFADARKRLTLPTNPTAQPTPRSVTP